MSKHQSKSENLAEVAFYVPNVLGYVRFFAIVASWKFAMTDPVKFTILYAICYFLGAIDGTVAKVLKQCSFFGAQMDILMNRFATESLIFAVLKLGITNIQNDSEKMKFTLLFGSLFLSDFVSNWFQVFSSYLIDQPSHKSSNPVLSILLKIFTFPVVNFAITTLSEAYTYSFYLSFFPDQYKVLSSHPQYELLLKVALAGAVLKNIQNFIHLSAASLRIVGIDVKQKNEAAAAQGKKTN
ncbi:cdp-diacylglycerol-inositol 3-phosphatidyltransferase [Stylonychia lemnae]|uniref:Cdp-diacylglycerol-inositol 3-phosphatidyltransferase n=1 Tax=Stylonychia lemnae TaxID=5949 RepID=A0A078AEJ1_STYLE|nr:cdp-diacylglycerol-inositol 3-phosphatidyltransferase [Stylonychia lemnae]|eukprot:CDW80689.1 cdp-diacylglycerol-inositol 3-phosphatidyltransferase [Stylonychia lemnae]